MIREIRRDAMANKQTKCCSFPVVAGTEEAENECIVRKPLPGNCTERRLLCEARLAGIRDSTLSDKNPTGKPSVWPDGEFNAAVAK